MENNNAVQELNQTQSVYTKYILNSSFFQMLFSASNVNVFVYIFWTIIYYSLYYGYTLKNMNKNIEKINQNIQENQVTNITLYKNKTLVETYQNIIPRIIPFFIFILIVVILQYTINVFIMRDKCNLDIYVSFRTLNIYTIGVWMVVLLLSFGFLYKMPKLKSVYSNSFVHTIFDKFMQPSKEIIYNSLFKKEEDVVNRELKELVKNINCNLMKSKTKEEKGENFDEYCNDSQSISFLDNINISNYNEYFKLMEPIINNNGQENEFLKHIIKKDILSEMLWIIKIGFITIAFIYTKLKSTKCLNHKKTYEENVKEYIDSKIKQCSVEEEIEENDNEET